jgi:hypothetical protein
LLFSEIGGRISKIVAPGKTEFMMHAEAKPAAEEIARVAKVTYKEVY